MRNSRVIELFSQREEASNQYLRSDSDRLYSVETIIAEWDYPLLYVNHNPEYRGLVATLENICDEDIEIVYVHNVPVGAQSLTNINNNE